MTFEKIVGSLLVAATGLVLAGCQSTVAENDESTKPITVDYAELALSVCLRDNVFGRQTVSARASSIQSRYAANQLLDRCSDQFDGYEDGLIADGMVRSEARRTAELLREDLFNRIVDQLTVNRR